MSGISTNFTDKLLNIVYTKLHTKHAAQHSAVYHVDLQVLQNRMLNIM